MLNIERRTAVILDAKNASYADRGQAVKTEAFVGRKLFRLVLSLVVHVPELVHEFVDKIRPDRVELVKKP